MSKQVPNQKWNKKLISLITVLFFSCLLLGGTIGYIFASGPSYETYYGAGGQTETILYTIWKDGSTYYAKNGETGQIEYSGASASLVINSVFTSCNSGDTVVLKGNITLTKYDTESLTAYNDVVEEWDYALAPPSGVTVKINGFLINEEEDVTAILIANKHDVTIIGGTIIGGKTADVDNMLIAIINSYGVKVLDAEIRETKTGAGNQGILIDTRRNDSTTPLSYGNKIHGCSFTGIGDYSIYVGWSRDNIISENWIRDVTKGIISAWDSYQNVITDNRIVGTTLYAIILQCKSYLNIVSNNVIVNSGDDGIILIYNVYRNTITGNTIFSPTKSGIRLKADEISGGVPPERAYIGDGFTTKNIVSANMIYSPIIDGIQLDAYNSKGNYENIIVGNYLDTCPYYYIREIEETSGVVDKNTYGNNRFGTPSTYEVMFTGAENVYDFMIQSEVIDLSAAAIYPIAWQVPFQSYLVGYKIFYTEASSADAGVSIKIGRYQAGGGLDNDAFDVTTSEINKNIGDSLFIETSQLTGFIITADDSITVGTGGGKVGTGEVQVILYILSGEGT